MIIISLVIGTQVGVVRGVPVTGTTVTSHGSVIADVVTLPGIEIVVSVKVIISVVDEKVRVVVNVGIRVQIVNIFKPVKGGQPVLKAQIVRMR